MYISCIHLYQFRNYTDARFEFSPGVTTVVGKNGSGKTNLLEAIYILGRGVSFRDSDEHLTRAGLDWWRVAGDIDDRRREVRHSPQGKQIIIDDKTFQRLSPQSRLPIVLFEPDDLMLIHGSPASRRRYLDKLIADSTSGYATTLRRYERIVAQRNSLLRAQTLDHDTLFVIDIMLADQAEKIVVARQSIIHRWNQQLSDYYSKIANTPHAITTNHQTTASIDNYKQSLLTRLKHNLDRDRLTGSTSVGPHRDDISFCINKKPFVTTASRGEVRSLILSLKSFEVVLAQESHGIKPILLLDDVFSELDTERQKQLMLLTSDHQSIMTSTGTIMSKRRHTEIVIAPL